MVGFKVIYLPTATPDARIVDLEGSQEAESSVIISKPGTDDSDAIRALAEIVPHGGSESCRRGPRLRLSTAHSLDTVWIVLYWYFQYTSATPLEIPKGKPIPERYVELILESEKLDGCSKLAEELEQLGLVDIRTQEGRTSHLVFANVFWQLPPELFLSEYNTCKLPPPKPLRYILSNGIIRHPKRPPPPPPKAPFYIRHCISGKVNSVFKLRPVDMSDLDLIHKWMNKPRVAEFWGEQGPMEHQKHFLEKCLSSQHSFAAIGSWNDLDAEGNLTVWKDACFFDIYWVKEDHLARYSNNIQDWDRGVHLLVGEDWARGRSTAWLDSLVHYMFLAEPRTQSVYLEPRVDNDLFIGLLTRYGFSKVKEFAFPHKQAALMKLDRDSWKGCN